MLQEIRTQAPKHLAKCYTGGFCCHIKQKQKVGINFFSRNLLRNMNRIDDQSFLLGLICTWVCASGKGMVFKPFGLVKGMVFKPFSLV